MRGFAALAANLCHVLAISAYCFSALACDLALSLRIHGCEPASALSTLVVAASAVSSI
jgi:hypothetical protein